MTKSLVIHAPPSRRKQQSVKSSSRYAFILIVCMSFAVTAACGSTQSSNLAQESAISRSVTTELVAAIDAPTAFAIRPGEPSSIIYIASQKGEISRVDLTTNDVSEFVSFRSQTTGTGERGLLGLAFSRDGNELYAHFTDLDGNTNIVAVEIRNGVPDLTTTRTLLFVEQPYSNHNGGQLLVDAAGNLLIGLGDGGASGDPLGNGQNPSSLLGKILRITPTPPGSTTPYLVPSDNPFAESDSVAPEIAFLGLRNPWRFSVDPTTGDFWIADVGQDSKEEINRVSGSELGANFGWNIKEGSEAFSGSTVATLTDPVHEWDNLGGSSAIGGFVYRGSAIKELQGKYLFADFAESGIFLFDPTSKETTFVDLPISKIVGFGEDANGEIFLLSLSSGVFALLPAQ
ncbi:MAG: sugar dehydrogenase [Actinobacteria bacterium]|nr:sugar dehydrogenase [Actinomycetota bacterium]